MSDEPQEQPEAVEGTLSKTETLRVLRDTIRRLEDAVNRLDAANIEALPPTATTETLQQSVETLESSIAAVAPPVKSVPIPPEPRNNFDRLMAAWDWVVDRVRALLPVSLNEKLSDWAITGTLATLTILIFSAIIVLLPDRAEPIPEPVAIVQPPPEAEDIDIPPQLEAPIEVEVPSQTAEVPEEPEVAEEAEVTEEPEVPEMTEVPEELQAPSEPETVVLEPPPPPPEPVLTPEQSLIAAIETQVEQLTSQYADGLIHSVEADFVGSRLKLAIAPDWYDFTPKRQNQVSREIWQRSQELDFRNLELVDLKGNLLARSPVVGKEMVIFTRMR
ncbi:MAG: hypothetical protein SW833_03295 [Cyanobacteriota bacterium]|nr:hypothetical protein [Cyanobacteriota bacterium]